MTLTAWQRANILSALNYLKEVARSSRDTRAETLGQGLAEVLEPGRRMVRLQREAAHAAAAGAGAGRERRTGADRRHAERRQKHLSFGASERRRGTERRTRHRRGSY